MLPNMQALPLSPTCPQPATGKPGQSPEQASPAPSLLLTFTSTEEASSLASRAPVRKTRQWTRTCSTTGSRILKGWPCPPVALEASVHLLPGITINMNSNYSTEFPGLDRELYHFTTYRASAARGSKRPEGPALPFCPTHPSVHTHHQQWEGRLPGGHEQTPGHGSCSQARGQTSSSRQAS